MLLERASLLKAALAKHLEVKTASQQAEVYRARARQLTPLAETLSQAHRDWAAIRTAGLISTPIEAKPSLRSHADDLLGRFKADRSALAEADETFRFQFVPGVRKAAEEFSGAAREAWTAHMAACDDFPSDDMLTALGAIPSYRPAVQRIREAAVTFYKLRDRTPSAADLPASLAQAAAARQQKDEALASVQGDEGPADNKEPAVPPEVQSFLRKTNQGGAPLSDLSSFVWTWLEERNLLRAFRIVPMSSNRDA